MFKDAKVGDRVWSARFGWGTVFDGGSIYKQPGQFGVKFDKQQYINYLSDGKQSGDDPFPTLFWDEVKIIPPPKPKRKVKKVIEFDIDIRLDQFQRPFVWIKGLHPDPISLITYPTTERLGDFYHIRHEYEVEE